MIPSRSLRCSSFRRFFQVQAPGDDRALWTGDIARVFVTGGPERQARSLRPGGGLQRTGGGTDHRCGAAAGPPSRQDVGVVEWAVDFDVGSSHAFKLDVGSDASCR